MLTNTKNLAFSMFTSASKILATDHNESNCSILGKIQCLRTEGDVMRVNVAPWSQFSGDVYHFFTTNPVLQNQLISAELGSRVVAIESKAPTLPTQGSPRDGGELLKLCTLANS